LAKKLWTLRWSLLKKPGNLSVEEKQAIAELESEEEGFVHGELTMTLYPEQTPCTSGQRIMVLSRTLHVAEAAVGWVESL